MAISFDQPLRPAVQQMATQIDDTLDFSNRVRIGYGVVSVPTHDETLPTFDIEFETPFELTDIISVIPTYANSYNGFVDLVGCYPVTYEGFTLYVANNSAEAQELQYGYIAFKLN